MKTTAERIAYHTRRIARWYPYLSAEEVEKLAIQSATRPSGNNTMKDYRRERKQEHK